MSQVKKSSHKPICKGIKGKFELIIPFGVRTETILQLREVGVKVSDNGRMADPVNTQGERRLSALIKVGWFILKSRNPKKNREAIPKWEFLVPNRCQMWVLLCDTPYRSVIFNESPNLLSYNTL